MSDRKILKFPHCEKCAFYVLFPLSVDRFPKYRRTGQEKRTGRGDHDRLVQGPTSIADGAIVIGIGLEPM